MSEFDPGIDYYAVLGVGSFASADEITRAYRALAAKYHPDKHQGNDLEELAKEKLAQINAAFAVIGNPERRARYDDARRGGRASQPPGGGAPPSAAPPRQGRTGLYVLLALAGLLLALRFVRNPRTLLIIAAVIAAIWLAPRIVRYFKK
ncbi:MAG: J domain-containing protein [Proteobacteria bacterium]|nr:J domain-containing protein [Pseudomonadota bacterium]